ncbi:DnaB-like helicase N-terminal domain-containing protein [Streptomyces sp. NBC_01205]|uniref:DnaB-like helicase N-terminal domain-containing protein n=1 Tax=Streptomyces sp. NBC_01205 TaxID=2903771 RepID=UPI002E14ED54|nr:hypothetical protein OG573_43330 [Streptomyces sp. NBC_01205]
MNTPAAAAMPEGESALRARVGRMLIDPGTIPETADAVLQEELSDRLAAVFTSVLAVYAAGEEPVSPLAVGIHLHRRGRLREIGGSAYLNALVEAGMRMRVWGPAALESSWFGPPLGAILPSSGYAPDDTLR